MISKMINSQKNMITEKWEVEPLDILNVHVLLRGKKKVSFKDQTVLIFGCFFIFLKQVNILTFTTITTSVHLYIIFLYKSKYVIIKSLDCHYSFENIICWFVNLFFICKLLSELFKYDILVKVIHTTLKNDTVK